MRSKLVCVDVGSDGTKQKMKRQHPMKDLHRLKVKLWTVRGETEHEGKRGREINFSFSHSMEYTYLPILTSFSYFFQDRFDDVE